MVIGFFMPLPLAMMIPFMGIQSAVMAKQFGENFQYGKRRISAMSNDEFNKLTPKMIQDNANAELKSMIPSMQASVTDMRGFQEFLVKEFIRMVDSLIQAGLGSLIGLTEKGIEQALKDIEHFLHGHPDLHIGETTSPPPPQTAPPPTQVPPGFPPLEVPPTVPTIPTPPTPPVEGSKPSHEFLRINGVGRIFKLTTGASPLWEMQANKGLGDGTHFKMFRGTKSQLLIKAHASWPRVSHRNYGVSIHGVQRYIYWILNSKL